IEDLGQEGAADRQIGDGEHAHISAVAAEQPPRRECSRQDQREQWRQQRYKQPRIQIVPAEPSSLAEPYRAKPKRELSAWGQYRLSAFSCRRLGRGAAAPRSRSSWPWRRAGIAAYRAAILTLARPMKWVMV